MHNQYRLTLSSEVLPYPVTIPIYLLETRGPQIYFESVNGFSEEHVKALESFTGMQLGNAGDTCVMPTPKHINLEFTR